jgi:hypothetical protein
MGKMENASMNSTILENYEFLDVVYGKIKLLSYFKIRSLLAIFFYFTVPAESSRSVTRIVQRTRKIKTNVRGFEKLRIATAFTSNRLARRAPSRLYRRGMDRIFFFTLGPFFGI